MDLFYERACKELVRLKKNAEFIREEIRTLPEGKLVITKNQSRYKWYWSKNGKTIYLPKKQEEVAIRLARKTYLEHRLKESEQEERALEFYIRHHKSGVKKSEEMMLENSRYRKLLGMEGDWLTEEYEKNPKFPEGLIHKSISGHLLRSKSEALIDRALFLNKIPFHYEERLELKGIVLYPDFKIMDPISGKVKYWEYLGMMDKPEYAQSALNKLELYIKNGLFPYRDLIITYETRETPLDYEMIEGIIQYYFL